MEKAENVPMSKSMFLNCLHEVNKQKLLAVKETRNLFDKRIKVLLGAKNYELSCQRIVAIEAAKQVIHAQVRITKDYFNVETRKLVDQFYTLIDLLNLQDKKLFEYTSTIAY